MYKEDLALKKNLLGLISHEAKTKLNNIYLIYMNQEDLAWKNLQRLICIKARQKN